MAVAAALHQADKLLVDVLDPWVEAAHVALDFVTATVAAPGQIFGKEGRTTAVEAAKDVAMFDRFKLFPVPSGAAILEQIERDSIPVQRTYLVDCVLRRKAERDGWEEEARQKARDAAKREAADPSTNVIDQAVLAVTLAKKEAWSEADTYRCYADMLRRMNAPKAGDPQELADIMAALSLSRDDVRRDRDLVALPTYVPSTLC